MQALAGAATAILVIASFAVAVRLLVLHRRSGGAPELLLGWMLLLSVGIGYPAMIAANRAGAEWAGTLWIVSTLAVNAGFSLLYAFTWRVFRPQERWAAALAATGAVVMWTRVVIRGLEVRAGRVLDPTNEPLGDALVQLVPVIVAYSWTAWESLHYYGLMRRRARIGLADPLVTNRFLLWGWMALSANAGVAFSGVWIALKMNILETPWILLLSSCTGMAQALFLVLAFVPPSFYSSWVRARATAAGA